MDDELRAITDRVALDPDDDAARLKAAAIFDRTDPPRAEHIRLGVIVERALIARHVAAARGEALPPKPTRHRLVALEAEHGLRWSGGLAARCEPAWNRPPVEFDRGFVASVQMRVETLLACADELAARHPIEELHVEPPADGTDLPLARVLELPLMRRVSVLGLTGWRITDRDCDDLAACANLPRCESIFLRHERLTDDRLAILGASERLRRVASLGVNESSFEPDREGRDRVWLSERATGLEEAYGTIHWLRPSRVRDLGAGRLAVRVLRALRAAGMESAAFELGPAGGSYRTLNYEGVTATELAAIADLLRARGYREGTSERLRYGVMKDATAPWGAWVYWLDVTEYSDAPVAADVARIIDGG